MSTREEVKALWKRCFDDNDTFVELYFEQKYKDEINLSITKNEKIVSALQMLPYSMSYCGIHIPVSYISGACTHPEWRGKGLMKQLLNNAHRTMFENGTILSILIPANQRLFQYYAESGYTPSFRYTRTWMSAPSFSPSGSIKVSDETSKPELIDEHYAFFSSRMMKRNCCIIHSKEDFQTILADWSLGKGNLLISRKEEQITGMAFVIMKGKYPIIKELLSDEQNSTNAILAKAMDTYQCKRMEYIIPSNENTQCLGMVKVIHIQALLNAFAQHYPERSIYIKVTEDKVIPENEGYYSVCRGKCIRQQIPHVIYQEYRAEELPEIILKDEHPYMSLMLD